METQSPLRNLPSVNEVLSHEAVQETLREYPRVLVVDAIRQTLEERRQRWLEGGDSSLLECSLLSIAAMAVELCRRQSAPLPRRVINATGIIVHTGLGRSLLAESVAQRMVEAAAYHCALEVDVETGERGSRDADLSHLLCRITGAEAGTVVNNNAAAVLLALNTLADGREVVVSRGQLVEIGGSFRIPDVMAKSGAKLVEVGTTNKTRLEDYRHATTESTSALLRVHTSNFRIVGFTEETSLSDLVALGSELNLPVMDDLGSGALMDLAVYGLGSEPLVQQSVQAGAHVVTFSGDKLLGGPQAGLIVGKEEWIRKIRKNPLYRAMRVDKLTLAALDATLRLYLEPDKALREIPTLRAITRPAEEVQRQANTLRRQLRGLPHLRNLEVRADYSQVGGGSLPTERIPTWLVTLQPETGSLQQFARRLRLSTPSVFCRIQDDRLCLDMRTVRPEELKELSQILREAVVDGSGGKEDNR